MVVYGRRRVGKTALIEKAFENEVIWKFEGIEGGTTREQIRHFLFTLGTYAGLPAIKPAKPVTLWQEALLLLDKALANRSVVVFFDEFQWTASMRNHLVAVFKWAWDNHFSRHASCRFVLCGSISSFIVKKVLRSKALYGRIDREIELKPLSLCETSVFSGSRRTAQETIDTYLVTGGIPQYLQEVNSGESLVQNLNRMAFVSQGYFVKEFRRLFISHFGRNKLYERILKSLASRHTQDPKALASSVDAQPGGTFFQLLEDLELAGFINMYSPLDKKAHSKLRRARLHDEFLDFYFTFVEPNLASIEEGTFKGFELLTGRAFDQWRGYAFERLCRKHAYAIAGVLGFSGIRYTSGSWFSRKAAAQIDLLFDRADRVFTVCEIKYCAALASDSAAEIERKTGVLRQLFNRPVQKVLISARRIEIPSSISAVFDHVLFAEDIFFGQ